MFASFIRTLRTQTSERFLFQTSKGEDCAALDLHYLPNGRVAGTLIIFEQANVPDETIPQILKRIDEDLLPDAKLKEGNLSFTVIVGRVVGDFVPESDK